MKWSFRIGYPVLYNSRPISSQEAEYLSRIWLPILVALLYMIGLSVGMPNDLVIQASDVPAKIKTGGPTVAANVPTNSTKAI